MDTGKFDGVRMYAQTVSLRCLSSRCYTLPSLLAKSSEILERGCCVVASSVNLCENMCILGLVNSASVAFQPSDLPTTTLPGDFQKRVSISERRAKLAESGEQPSDLPTTTLLGDFQKRVSSPRDVPSLPNLANPRTGLLCCCLPRESP